MDPVEVAKWALAVVAVFAAITAACACAIMVLLLKVTLRPDEEPESGPRKIDLGGKS